MNVVPPVPTPIVFSAGVVNTESARRDNVQREVVPPLAASENSAAETGVGSESDKVKTPGQVPQPLTYEKPVPQSGQQLNTLNDSAQDNGQDASAGKENAEDRQQQQAEEQKLTELKQRDAEVRAHEQAHAAVGGQYAGSPQYEYERGPDGRQYAVGGEVSIDVSKEATPEETINKAQQVKAAALAPSEPSAQDLRVASEASQIALEARSEIAKEKSEEAQEAYDQALPNIEQGEQSEQSEDTAEGNVAGAESPGLDDIIDAVGVSLPNRSLDISDADSQVDSSFDAEGASQFIANRDAEITRRVSVIENFYQQVTTPEPDRLNLSA